MPNRVAIFIDGGYLDKVLETEFPNADLSYQKLSAALAGDGDILRTYYYHSLPYQGTPPTEEQQARYSGRRSFFNALERLPRYTVRLGRLAYVGRSRRGGPIFEQKQVDILLGIDLVLLAAKHLIQEAILVTGDSDFIPAVTVAKAEGVLVRLYHGVNPHNSLWQEADERVPFTAPFIESLQR